MEYVQGNIFIREMRFNKAGDVDNITNSSARPFVQVNW